MTDTQKIALSLTLNERKILKHLKEKNDFHELVSETRLKEIEVLRAIQWLQSKNLIETKEELKESIALDKNGEIYAKKGLPEKLFLHSIKDKELSLDAIIKSANLEKDEASACIGILKTKQAINMKDGKISITKDGVSILNTETDEEKFIKKLLKDNIEKTKLNETEKIVITNLQKRKNIIKTEITKIKTVTLTKLGKEVIKEDLDIEVLENLSPSLLSTGNWKGKTFRRYDVTGNIPKIYGGKRHFVKTATDYSKKIWLNMGFKEMTGTYTNTSFWNFDALFTAQDHPVREMQDTFFIGMNGKLPKEELIKKVKHAHEEGTEGSLGWRYEWKEDEAKKVVLRTHTTVLSAQTIAKLKSDDLPRKYFALGRCFRNETMDWSHLFEFNQTEGIVIDPDANFRHLLGYLKQFFKQMGFPDARFRPAHFPYTEPSVEIDVWHPTRNKWMEIGGAGIFRPEVVEPLLGKFVPILAWGPGFDRIILEYYNVTDIRDLYKNDIKQLREMKTWLK